ncbi:MAG: transcriptional regulator [Gemmatimonadota bacterium]
MKSYGQYCGLARALDHVGDRWTLLIVRELLAGPKRFTDLREALAGAAANLLSARLRRLELDGIVVRDFLEPPAARNVYSLTELGRGLREPIEALVRWGGHWMAEGRGDDSFECEWLALALGAVGVGRRGEGDVIEFQIDQKRARLAIGPDGVVSVPASGPPPAFSVRAEPETLLGLAVGAIPAERAEAELIFSPDDEQVRRRFMETFVPASGS